MLRDVGGAQGLFVDVGIDTPVDLAITHLKLPELANGDPQQVFAPDEIIRLRAVVKATGKDMSTTLTCKLGSKVIQQRPAEVKAGESCQTIFFEIDGAELKLGPARTRWKSAPIRSTC